MSKSPYDQNTTDFARRLIDTLYAFVGVMTLEGKLVEANRTALEAAGLKPEDVIGKMFPDTHWWSYSEPLKARLWQAIHEAVKGTSSRFDAKILVKNGEYIIIDFMLMPMRDDSGKVCYLVPSAIDITERKRVEESYKESQARLAMANQSGGIGTWDWDTKSPEILWDEQMLKLFFYASGSGFSRSLEDFYRRLHPDDRNRLEQELLSSLQNGIYKSEFRIISPEGSIRWILGHGKVFYDEDGKPKRMLGINRDITDEMSNRKLHEEREARLRMVLDLAHLGAFTWTTVSQSRQLSAQAKSLIGLEKDSITQSEFLTCIHPADREMVTAAFHRGINELQDYSVEYRIVKKDGTIRWIWERGKTLVDFLTFSATGITGAIQDITAIKEAESNRRNIERQREAIEGRDEFISIAAHELKTPISSLMLEIQLLKSYVTRSESQDEKLRELTRKAEISVQNLSRLTQDLFDVTQLRTGKLSLTKENMNLSETVNEEVKRIRLTENYPGTIQIQAASDISGNWDRVRISQVIRNILKNAIRYGADGPIEIKVSSEDSFAILEITDHGPGIPEELQRKIFNRFERGNASNIPGGLGLGLYVCQLIVAEHQGNISVRSQPGKGASFVVRLPKQ